MEHAVSHHEDHGHENHESLKILGFWIFLVTDCILFGSLFATYVVLRTHTDGGPTGKELFEVPGFVTETFLLLTSSFTSGLATLAMHKGKLKSLIGWLIVTVLLGLGFIGFEVSEFTKMAMEGATISRSAFLSAFFTLVGTHGLHVSVGLIWMIGIIFQLKHYGITDVTNRKVSIISLYWHFLDAVWIFLFTVVYLMGVM
ncbi:cytochrome o ubiquinol oxidase subunit III [Aneurinibacillus terranovensis]|uniref:cytochrome o ubiquinol oxidase subunit III n=1 Tax=Aneurinibacillus terranovensis TaxID=278991 RepID=UPI0003F69F59|nr:cytochrome o ubiquinol oxidase subunit III [Aneurinibacillus terranovensis]